MSNVPDEGQRLRERYAGMSDGELERIAATAFDLTEEAHAALTSEILRRGLDFRLNDEPPGYDQPEFHDTTTIRRYRDLSEAMFAKGPRGRGDRVLSRRRQHGAN